MCYQVVKVPLYMVAMEACWDSARGSEPPCSQFLHGLNNHSATTLVVIRARELMWWGCLPLCGLYVIRRAEDTGGSILLK